MSEQPERLSVVKAVPARVLRHLEPALAGTGPAVAPVACDLEHATVDRAVTSLAPAEPLEAPGIAAVLTTSGSTGEPKGVLLSAAALRHSATATLARLGGPGQWLLALPVDRIAGLQILVRTIVGGSPAPELCTGDTGRFEPDAFVAATDRLTSGHRRYVSLVPTQLVRLLDSGPAAVEALRSYDAILVGGAAANATLLARARSERLRIVTTYGMTETCGGCVYDGTPLDGVSVGLDPQGRIEIAGPVLFSGYRLRPDLTASALVNGRHVTADLGRIDEDGRLDVLGRSDDIVVSGGVNVPLPAVENTVAALPSVAEAAVVGVPDPVWGTRVVAYVVVGPGAEAPTLPQVREHVAGLHPRAFAPRRLVIVDALPLLSSGKVDRAALIEKAVNGSDRAGA
ncbi:MAG TPA: o-succinylbenzoate--CoA ligase [Actinopolymorphaceae bacterium]